MECSPCSVSEEVDQSSSSTPRSPFTLNLSSRLEIRAILDIRSMASGRQACNLDHGPPAAMTLHIIILQDVKEGGSFE